MSVGRDVAGSLKTYLKAQVQNAFITTLLFVIGFAMAGVPWWLLTGLVCGVVNLVPYFGPLIAVGLALLIQFFAYDGWQPLAYVAAVWFVVQVVDGFVLSPRAASRSGVNPFLSILLVLVAGLVLGPIGMIVIVPVTAVFLIIYRALRKRPAV